MTATTCQDIIDRAMGSMGVIAGTQITSGADAETGLRGLQDLIIDLPLLLDGEWRDVFLTDATPYSARDGDRVFTQGHAAVITLPMTFIDHFGVVLTDHCGRTHATLDCSRVQIIGSGHAQEGVWVYTSSKGAWAQVDALTISGDSPFGKEDDAGLAALLAIALGPEYGSDTPDITVNRAQRCQAGFRARFYRDVNVPLDHAFVRMSVPGYDRFFEGPNA